MGVSASDEEVMEVAKLASIDEFIILCYGLDSMEEKVCFQRGVKIGACTCYLRIQRLYY